MTLRENTTPNNTRSSRNSGKICCKIDLKFATYQSDKTWVRSY